MILGEWLLIETLDVSATWSVLAVGTAPRQWKSLSRTVPARLVPLVAAAHTTREPVERDLPKSRHAWSRQKARAVPVVGPDNSVHAVQFWVGTGEPPALPPVAPFVFDSRTRRLEVISGALGPMFDRGRSVWVGAETFQYIERFDGALEWVMTMSRADPDSHWLSYVSVRSHQGLRTLMTAARNLTADPQCWRGLLMDVTDHIPPQGKSFEATTVDALCSANPGLYLAMVDTERIRLIRWVSAPIPGLRWAGDTDERTLPHPDDVDRILAARTDILGGALVRSIPGLRLAAEDGGWLLVDAEVSPLPYGLPDGGPPAFALVRFELHTP